MNLSYLADFKGYFIDGSTFVILVTEMVLFRKNLVFNRGVRFQHPHEDKYCSTH